jgi:hypothetical protein
MKKRLKISKGQLEAVNRRPDNIMAKRRKDQQWRGVLYTTLCDKVCQWLATGRWFSPQWKWPPRYNWNIVESGAKHHLLFYGYNMGPDLSASIAMTTQ